MMTYRLAVHESTIQSPFRLVFGKEMLLPIDMLYPTLPSPIGGHRDYTFQILVEYASIFNSVIRNGWEMRRQKAIFDKKSTVIHMRRKTWCFFIHQSARKDKLLSSKTSGLGLTA